MLNANVAAIAIKWNSAIQPDSRGLPAKVPGDFYFVLQLAVPVTSTEADRKAYADMAAAFTAFDPRAHLKELEGQA